MRPVIDRLLLGDNAFIGVNHLSQEKLREKRRDLGPKEISTIIDTALDSGAQGIACSAHPIMKNSLSLMRDENYAREFGVYLIIPDAQSYVRIASENGLLGMLNMIMGQLSLKGRARAIVAGGFSVLTSNPLRLMRAYVDMELSRFAESLPKGAKIRALFLHELLTELIVSFEMYDFANEYINYVRDSLDIIPGFVTRNFARFIEFGKGLQSPLTSLAIMSPFNRTGFQMNPSRVACEAAISNNPGLNVIAMSVLAGGYLTVEEAVDYLKLLPAPVSCVVGCSTEVQARKTFTLMKSYLTWAHGTHP